VKLYLGFDVGGTKTRALIADGTGHAVGAGLAGAGNYEVVGWEGLATALRDALADALASAGVAAADVAGVGFGISGYDWPGERIPHLDAIESLGLGAPYTLVNDAMIGLIAGASEGWGVAIISGTGANCWGRDRTGRLGHTTGGADMLGEYGGADTLVPEAIRAVSKAFTRRGPATALSEALVRHTGASGVEDLLEGLFVGRYEIGTDASPVVFGSASAGDAVAQSLIRWAGRGLGSLLTGVVRQLSLQHEAVEVVKIGSLFGVSPVLEQEMMSVVRTVAPAAWAVDLTAPPVAGAVMLAMETAGIDVAPARSNIVASAAALD